MLNRYAVLLVAGAAIFALDASAASAQDTTRTRPRSTKRIPITKEASGEVSTTPVVARVDTVTVYKTDTLRLQGRVDTVNVTKTETITRVDTVLKPAIPEILRQIGGFYIGLAAGSSLPAANFNDSDHPGWRIEVPVGIDPIGSPLGVRFNFGYSRYEPHTYAEQFLDNAQLMNVDGDLKLRLVKLQPLQQARAGLRNRRRVVQPVQEHSREQPRCVERRRRARGQWRVHDSDRQHVAQRLGLEHRRRPRNRLGRHESVRRIAVLALQR